MSYQPSSSQSESQEYSQPRRCLWHAPDKVLPEPRDKKCDQCHVRETAGKSFVLCNVCSVDGDLCAHDGEKMSGRVQGQDSVPQILSTGSNRQV